MSRHSQRLGGFADYMPHNMQIDPDTCRDPDLLAAEVRRLRAVIDAGFTLTAEERRDIAIAADAYADNDDDPDCERIAATLRGLLERTA